MDYFQLSVEISLNELLLYPEICSNSVGLELEDCSAAYIQNTCTIYSFYVQIDQFSCTFFSTELANFLTSTTFKNEKMNLDSQSSSCSQKLS